MSPIAILGSGFGLYGYLPALVSCCGQRVVLPERYREQFEQRSELAPFARYVQWAADELAALRQASGAVIAQCPQMQGRWLESCLNQPQIKRLFLEKPLAPDPATAGDWLTRLEESGKVIRIAYLFRDLAWAAALRKSIIRSPGERITIHWNFMAHHFSHTNPTWKRDHMQGGGALRFYGIHLIALLSELGYSSATHSTSKSRGGYQISQWNAVFMGAGLPNCEVFVNSEAAETVFSLVSDSTSPAAVRIEQADPFANTPPPQQRGALDRRVDVLGRFCKSAWSDKRRLLNFYRTTIDLWQSTEAMQSSEMAYAAA